MSQPSKLASNLELLEKIKKDNPSATHVYVRRFNREGADIGWVDIPIGTVLVTLKQHPDWEILSSNKQMDDEVEKLFNEKDGPENPWDKDKELADVDVPPKPSEESPATAVESQQNATSTQEAAGEVAKPAAVKKDAKPKTTRKRA